MATNDNEDKNKSNNSVWCIGDTLDKLCYDEEANRVERSPSLEWNEILSGGVSPRGHDREEPSNGMTVLRNKKSKTKDEDDGTETDDSFDAKNSTSNVKARVLMISGCEDSQTSADVSNVSQFSLPDPQGKAGGACTSALLHGKSGLAFP